MTQTKEKIIEYIGIRQQATASELSRHLGITRQAVHRQMNTLLVTGQIAKVGRPPKVYYVAKESEDAGSAITLPVDLRQVLDEHFIAITPSGERKEGVSAFSWWCKKHQVPFEKTAAEYGQTIKKYEQYKKDGLIDGRYKLKHTFDQVYLDEVVYLDFYAIERFGKTKLGQLLLYAKQSQNQTLMAELARLIKPRVDEVIGKYVVDAIGFIPPTVKREVQLMKEIERGLNIHVPTITLVKVKTAITVPQKTLTKLEDRVENARNTIVVDEHRTYKTVLLIDDALGSGATMNETAKKIKERKLADVVIGLAITGSFSGFEVISEV